MTDQERVLQIYPNARSWNDWPGRDSKDSRDGPYLIVTHRTISGAFPAPEYAWEDAWKRIQARTLERLSE